MGTVEELLVHTGASLRRKDAAARNGSNLPHANPVLVRKGGTHLGYAIVNDLRYTTQVVEQRGNGGSYVLWVIAIIAVAVVVYIDTSGIRVVQRIITRQATDSVVHHHNG